MVFDSTHSQHKTSTMIIHQSKVLQGSVDSQLDVTSLHGSKVDHERKSSLARSQTDSNITYSNEEAPEAPGSAFYITRDGDINLKVVLKV